ncbi:alpha/beta hydrolase [Lactobacillus delbrueckii]|uniref:alpha/beta hydrolase n=1 Tax=Lactobacillus delbrueckii TaxID=1584 RepID=UPI001EE915D8|nr:alpha/beta hydrolase [Lactobacillus delbrueckii]
MYVSANHKNGKPIHMNDNYKRQLVLRKLYPHAKVLNVYGDLEDGSHSDGRVKNSSSKSLRYLVSPKVKSYKEKIQRKEIYRPNGPAQPLAGEPASLKDGD